MYSEKQFCVFLLTRMINGLILAKVACFKQNVSTKNESLIFLQLPIVKLYSLRKWQKLEYLQRKLD